MATFHGTYGDLSAAFLQRGRRAADPKLRRRRRQRAALIGLAAAGLAVIAVINLSARLGAGVQQDAETSQRETAAPRLDVIIDARWLSSTLGLGPVSHTWLANALCMPARLGVFQNNPESDHSGSTAGAIIVDDAATARRLNANWGLRNAALIGGAGVGRAAVARSMAAGRGFLLAPGSALWLQDLRDAVFTRAASNATDRPGVHTDPTCDVAVAGASSSILAVRPTPAGRLFADALLRCEASKPGLAARKSGPADRGGGATQAAAAPASEPVFSDACLRQAVASTPDVRTCSSRHQPSFHMSTHTFDTTGPAVTGLWPATVVVESANAASATDLQDRGLWSLAPDGTCPAERERLRAASHSSSQPSPFSLRIRVLTMGRPASLRRLLDSLTAADYLGNRVALDFLVDAPPSNATAAAHAETLAIVSAFTWPHGSLSIDIADRPRGLANQWTAWRPDGDEEACLVLEDDLEVAPTFYAWSMARLTAYWAGVAHRDNLPSSRLAAISLSHQNKVVGEIGGLQMYGKTDIGALLADGAPSAYLAQQVSSWAPILLPRPWRHFVHWWENERAALPARRCVNGTEEGPSPCLPGLASNQWWAKAPGTMWTVWWHRFAAAAGYVFLYQDPRAGPPQAVNHKEPGEHFKVKQNADGELSTATSTGGPAPSWGSRPSVDAPALHTLPVYDLHMRPLGLAGGSGLRALALRASFYEHARTLAGSCEGVEMPDSQRRWLQREEGIYRPQNAATHAAPHSTGNGIAAPRPQTSGKSEASGPSQKNTNETPSPSQGKEEEPRRVHGRATVNPSSPSRLQTTSIASSRPQRRPSQVAPATTALPGASPPHAV